MKKILILVNHDIVIYNFRLELVERLLTDGNEVHISSPYGERIDDLLKIGCYYHEIKISRHGKNPFKDLKLIKNYKELMNNVKPDVCFGYTIKPNIYGAIAAHTFKIPFIANITGLGTALEKTSFIQKLVIILYKYAFRGIHKVMFQNSDNKQFFIDHNIAIGKHELIPGSGVNLDKYYPLPYPNSSTIEFVFISRIMKEKGIDQFLEAANYIKTKYINVNFHVCGFCEEEYRGQLNSYIEKGIVNYHGMVKDVRNILKFTHCTVLPTYYPEGISNTLLESAACARPIITTNRSGCREVIDDGINGFICKSKDTYDLIIQLEKFISIDWSRKKEMGLAGRKKVEKEFDRQIIVEKYIDELKTL